jgi:hypothetical protein
MDDVNENISHRLSHFPKRNFIRSNQVKETRRVTCLHTRTVIGRYSPVWFRNCGFVAYLTYFIHSMDGKKHHYDNCGYHREFMALSGQEYER